MKLPAIPFLTKSVSTEYFLSLIFEFDRVGSILFKEQEKSLNILASHEVGIDLEKTTSEELIVACDRVISKIETNLPEGANLEKTIFAVPHLWVDEGRIRPEKLKELKRISEELALTPMGFIVSIEAIIASLQKKEGAPVNGIFVEITQKFVNVFIVRGSNIIDNKTGEIEGTVEKTVESLLASVTKLDVLPSKIVLLHNKEAEEISQRFLSHHWTKDLSFMHLPQVSILNKGFENEAIINGVATQLSVSVSGGIESVTREESLEDEVEDQLIDDGFGFEMDEDVANKKEEENAERKVEEDNFEFNQESEDTSKEEYKEENNLPEYEDEDVKDEKVSQGFVSGIGSSISSLLTPQSFARLINSFRNFRRFIIPFAAFIVVVVLLITYYSFVVRAKVTVLTDQRAFSENEMDIILTTDGESSFSDKTLKVKAINEEVEGEQSQETTGTKDTGKEATGTVTIFNKTESPKTLNEGTTIVSSNNLEFTLDSSVNIASTSSFSTSFSNTQGKVTAAKFGKEYNLPSQTNFTVEGVSSSDIFARNDQAFSGGSKEQIRVVSQKDLQTLEDALVERLFEKAKDQAEQKLSQDEALIPVYLDVSFSEKTFDRKLNDEANSVKLNTSIAYTLGSYNKEELINFVASAEDFDVPDDFKLSDSDSTINITDIEKDGDDISAKLSFKAVFRPQLNEESLPQLVSGKGTQDAIDKLKEVQGVSDVSIEYSNAIPFLPKIMPLNKGNISLEFKSE